MKNIWLQIKKWLWWFFWCAFWAFVLLGLGNPAQRSWPSTWIWGVPTVLEIEAFNKKIPYHYLTMLAFVCSVSLFFILSRKSSEREHSKRLYEIAWKGVRKEVEEGRFWVPDEEREKTLHPIETEVRRAFWEEITQHPWDFPAQFPDAQPTNDESQTMDP
ncbi:MAG: hypothetical protein Q4D38_12220 [Planctomycetia bacterium]|nr:hypothetical protein [Planctomycetia bacterium]